MKVLKTLCFAVSLLSLPLECLAQAPAQAPKSSSTVVVHRKKPALTQRGTNGNDVTQLDKAPDMPGVTLPNAKLLSAFSTETKNGRNVGAQFACPELGTTVVAYYKNALKSNGWLVVEDGKLDQVCATHTQYKASITITALPSGGNAGSHVQFSYGTHN